MTDAFKVFGIFAVILGGIMVGDARMLGLKGPAVGICVVTAGVFALIYSVFGQTAGGNQGGSGRRVRDHSV